MNFKYVLLSIVIGLNGIHAEKEDEKKEFFSNMAGMYIPSTVSSKDIEDRYAYLRSTSYGNPEDRLNTAHQMYKILQHQNKLPRTKFTQSGAEFGKFTVSLMCFSVFSFPAATYVFFQSTKVLNLINRFKTVSLTPRDIQIFSGITDMFAVLSFLLAVSRIKNSDLEKKANYDKEKIEHEKDTLRKIQKEVQTGTPFSELESTYRNIVNRDILEVLAPAYRKEK